MNYEAKSIIIGRKPRVDGNEFKTAFVKVYDKINPLTIEEFPPKELDFPNMEKVVFNTFLEYYLEGNDIVLDNLESVDIETKGTTVTITPHRASE